MSISIRGSHERVISQFTSTRPPIQSIASNLPDIVPRCGSGIGRHRKPRGGGFEGRSNCDHPGDHPAYDDNVDQRNANQKVARHDPNEWRSTYSTSTHAERHLDAGCTYSTTDHAAGHSRNTITYDATGARPDDHRLRSSDDRPSPRDNHNGLYDESVWSHDLLLIRLKRFVRVPSGRGDRDPL